MQHRRCRALTGALALTAAVSLGVPRLASAGAEPPDLRHIKFPVQGEFRLRPDFGDYRSGGRRHAGNDIFAEKMTPVVAALEGRVTFVRRAGPGNSGVAVVVTDGQGWQYKYFHLNNDSPGTDDNADPPGLGVAPGIEPGVFVRTGQLLGWVGDSGNAEETPPHLHFEIRTPGGVAVDPFPSLASADDAPVALWSVRGVAAAKQGAWILAADGRIKAVGGAPHLGEARFGRPLARAIAAMPDGEGYIVVDAWGGLHRFGSAATGAMATISGPFWEGQDMVRGAAVTPSGEGIVVLDKWGGAHSRGDAPPLDGPGWFPGEDFARGLALTPSGKGALVLDAWGGVHARGDARKPVGGPFWEGWDVARAVVMSPTGEGYAVLDAFGGLHAAGDMPKARGGSYQPRNAWRGLALREGEYVAVRWDGLVEERPEVVPPQADNPKAKKKPNKAKAAEPAKATTKEARSGRAKGAEKADEAKKARS